MNLPQDFWIPLLPYLDEYQLSFLRRTGDRRVIGVLQSPQTLRWIGHGRNMKSLPFLWPVTELRSSRLVDLELKLRPHDLNLSDPDPPTGYELKNLPKTLRRLSVHFPGALKPFGMSGQGCVGDVLQSYEEYLPALEDLRVGGPTEERYVLLPPTLTRFSFPSWFSSSMLHPGSVPRNLESLELYGIDLDVEVMVQLPLSLKELIWRTGSATSEDMPPLPYLTRLSLPLLTPRQTTFKCEMPLLQDLSIVLHAELDVSLNPELLILLSSLPLLHTFHSNHPLVRLDPSLLPQSLTKWTTDSVKRQKVGGMIDFLPSAVSALPPLLKTLSFNLCHITTYGVLEMLPAGLTSLDFRRTRLDKDEYQHLPTTLTELFVPTYNSYTAKYITLLTQLREFGAFGGVATRKSIELLPRSLTALQFHGMALDTSLHRHHTKKHAKAGMLDVNKQVTGATLPLQVPEAELNAFQGTLPPNLKKLLVFHHQTHLYYWKHAAEIYKDLPVSLEELHLLFWRDKKIFSKRNPKGPTNPKRPRAPSYIKLEPEIQRSTVPTPVSAPKSTLTFGRSGKPSGKAIATPSSSSSPSSSLPSSSQSSHSSSPPRIEMFSRLVNLKALTMDHPASASNDHSIPPLPSTGSLKYLYYECWLSFTKEDGDALPETLASFRTNLHSYSDEYVKAKKRYPVHNHYYDDYCQDRIWARLY